MKRSDFRIARCRAEHKAVRLDGETTDRPLGPILFILPRASLMRPGSRCPLEGCRGTLRKTTSDAGGHWVLLSLLATERLEARRIFACAPSLELHYNAVTRGLDR